MYNYRRQLFLILLQVIIIADQFAPDPDEEDAKNIMRAISIKNVCEDLKVIIEVLQYYNKVFFAVYDQPIILSNIIYQL